MKNNKKTLTAILLAAALSLSMAACGEEKPSGNTSSTASGTSSQSGPAPVTPAADKDKESLRTLRTMMEPSGAMAGILFLGVYHGDPLTDEYYDMINEQGYPERYPFLKNIPMGNYVKTEGNEVYCIIPADPKATVTVTEWSEETGGTAGKTLYQKNSGEPFIVQGNISDIMPNLSVTIANANGLTLSNYHPRLSLQDSTLLQPQDPDFFVMDLTVYGPGPDGAVGPIPVTFDLYLPNADYSQLERRKVTSAVVDDQFVLMQLIEARVLPDTVKLNEAYATGSEGKDLTLDFNSEFGTFLQQKNNADSTMIVNSVVNSFLSSGNLKTVTITVEGAPLNTGYKLYTDPFTFIPVP